MYVYKALPCENEPQSTIVTATSSTRTPMNSTKKRSMSWVIRWKREAQRALPGREASLARSEALSRVRRSQPTGADRFAVLDDHLRAGVLNAPRTRNASRCRTERRTATRQRVHCDELFSLRKSQLTQFVGTFDTTKLKCLDDALMVALGLLRS